MHGPEELLASYVMLLVAHPKLLVVENKNTASLQIIVTAHSLGEQTSSSTDIKCIHVSVTPYSKIDVGNNETLTVIVIFSFSAT
jgi:hypothetical protein